VSIALGTIFAVDAHVLGAQVTRPHGGVAAATGPERHINPDLRSLQVRLGLRCGIVMRQPELNALNNVEPARFTLAKVDPDDRDFVALSGAIADLRAGGRPTEEATTGWWHKISGPLSTVLMPLLAATAAFGLARSGHVLLRACIGMALGFAYFVADNFSVALGNYGAYPPILAAWAPFFLFLLIGEFVLIRQEE